MDIYVDRKANIKAATTYIPYFEKFAKPDGCTSDLGETCRKIASIPYGAPACVSIKKNKNYEASLFGIDTIDRLVSDNIICNSSEMDARVVELKKVTQEATLWIFTAYLEQLKKEAEDRQKIKSPEQSKSVVHSASDNNKNTQKPYRVKQHSPLSATSGAAPLDNVFVEAGSCVSVDTSVRAEKGKSVIVTNGQANWTRALIDTKNIQEWKDFPAQKNCNPSITYGDKKNQKTQSKEVPAASVNVQIDRSTYKAYALAGYSYYVTAQNLNIREKPSAQADIVGQTSRTSCLTVYGKASGAFLPVMGRTSDGTVFTGYAHRDHLRKTDKNKGMNCGASFNPAP